MKKKIGYLLLVLLLVGCSSEENNPLNDSYADIEKTMQIARRHSVEAYIDAIWSKVLTYIAINDSSEKITICAQNGNVPNTCIIDASPDAKEGATSQGKEPVTYSGNIVSCESIKYDQKEDNIIVTNCTVGDYLEEKYSGDLNSGVSIVKN